jgi:hypothetical protein
MSFYIWTAIAVCSLCQSFLLSSGVRAVSSPSENAFTYMSFILQRKIKCHLTIEYVVGVHTVLCLQLLSKVLSSLGLLRELLPQIKINHFQCGPPTKTKIINIILHGLILCSFSIQGNLSNALLLLMLLQSIPYNKTMTKNNFTSTHTSPSQDSIRV